MNVIIEKSNIKGKITVPSSKSYTHRALICSALAPGKSRIISPLDCDDTQITLENLRKMGVRIDKHPNFWEIENKHMKSSTHELFCGKSGTTLRFLTSVCSLFDKKSKLTGEKSLMRRPMKPLMNSLRELGADSFYDNDSIIVQGRLNGGKTSISGNISSQFISGLLLVSPLASKDVKIQVTTQVESKPYILMTIKTQRDFGVKVEHSINLRKFQIRKQNYKSVDYKIEGDWSSASYLLAAGILSGSVEIDNIELESLQGDRKILEILKKMGADIFVENGLVGVKKSKLRAINVNLSDCPDLFPIICVLCSVAEGRSTISGIDRLQLKESDRIDAMREGLGKMGINFTKKQNSVLIEGSEPNGTVIYPKNDHRIAMAFGILGLITKGKTIIKDMECVSKSFPGFWEKLKNIGGNIKY